MIRTTYFVSESQFEGRCDPRWYTPRGDSCYGYYEQPKSFEDAAALCERNYGHLVSISDVEENAFVTRLTNGERAWIGGLRNTSLCKCCEYWRNMTYIIFLTHIIFPCKMRTWWDFNIYEEYIKYYKILMAPCNKYYFFNFVYFSLI